MAVGRAESCDVQGTRHLYCITHTTHTGIAVTNNLNMILRYTAHDATRDPREHLGKIQNKEMKGKRMYGGETIQIQL